MRNRTVMPTWNQALLHPTQIQTEQGSGHCWCCQRRLAGHRSLCHCGQPHYCEGRPPNWCQRTG